MADDYYKILNVERGASPEEIKKSYRRLAHKFHPDKEGGDEEKFKQINEAYQVLGDETKRRQYDQFGQAFSGGAGGPFGFGGFGQNINMDDLGGIGDIFETFFGGRGRGGFAQREKRGEDVQVDVELSFKEPAQQVSKDVQVRLRSRCQSCGGRGAVSESGIETCSECNGQGVVTQTSRTPLGVFSRQAVCARCRGEGKIVKDPCSGCRGEGRVMSTQDISVVIPAGISDGQVIRLAGRGEAPPRGGQSGDLFVTVHVRSDENMKREGVNVHSDVTLPFTDAILGTEVNIETLAGTQKISIPPGTQPGQVITMTGQGFPVINSGRRGDHLLHIVVSLPKRVNKKQKRLLGEFKAAKGWFS